jgi:hypothetical protein
MLASDGERDATIARLRSAHLAGRIDTSEFERRIERAQAATTRDELAELRADLPAAEVDPRTTTGAPRLPGRRHFEVRRLAAGTPEEVRERLLSMLERAGFALHRELDGEQQYAHRRELGSRIALRLHEAPGGTLVHARGRAPLAVRRALARL